ncbi:MAG: HD domain-containing protein [Bacteroidales bacterium]|nr:HD domain-containing protein [Bacteroidales bacterium]
MVDYIYNDITSRYADFDPAHREDHVLTVISQAMELLDRMPQWLNDHPEAADEWNIPVDRNILLAAAACHDLGLVNGRENHHLDSGKIIRSDRRLREWFDEDQIEIIAQAAEDHRASGKSAPRSIYGMLVAEADRVIDGETIIRRTIQFGMKHYPDLDKDGHIERAVAHLREKYGRGGYLKLWIPWSDNAARLSALQDTIASDDAIITEVRRVAELLNVIG